MRASPHALLKRWNDHVAQPPSRVAQAISALLAVALPVWLWDERGPVVGAIAVLVYTPLFLAGAFWHAWLVDWSARQANDDRLVHRALTPALVSLLAFLAFAGLTDWPIGLCALAGVGAWLLLGGLIRATRPRGGDRPGEAEADAPGRSGA